MTQKSRFNENDKPKTSDPARDPVRRRRRRELEVGEDSQPATPRHRPERGRRRETGSPGKRRQ